MKKIKKIVTFSQSLSYYKAVGRYMEEVGSSTAGYSMDNLPQ
jgi:hypothetical protein